MNFTSLKQEYKNLIDTMEVRPEWKDAIDRRARAILANKERYKQVSDLTGVPWEVIGVIHSLECNLDFTQALHNGDPIIGTGQKTRRIPRGRGPFATWEDAAVDALKYDGLSANTDWSDEKTCYMLEKYNGFGYRTKSTGVNSPYLWSGSNHYTIGKFVSDGKFVKTAKSAQSGAWLLIARLREIDIDKKQIVQQSSKLSFLRNVRTSLGGLSLTGMFAEAMGYLEPVKDFILENKYFFAAGAFITLFVILKIVESKGVKEYKEGRYIPSGQVKE